MSGVALAKFHGCLRQAVLWVLLASGLLVGQAQAEPLAIGAEGRYALSRAFTRVDRAFLSSVRPAFDLGFGDVARVEQAADSGHCGDGEDAPADVECMRDE